MKIITGQRLFNTRINALCKHNKQSSDLFELNLLGLL